MVRRTTRWQLGRKLPLDRETLPQLLPWSQRRKAHVALARLLNRDPIRLAKAADHFAAAGMNDEAGRSWLSAARTYCRKHQHLAAAECFERAIRHLPAALTEDEMVEAVRDFGLCASMQRAHEPARELLREWRERPALANCFHFQAEAARVTATLPSAAQRHVEAAQARREAASHCDRVGQTADGATELVAAAMTLAYSLQITAAEQTAARANESARVAGRADLQTEAMIVRGLCLGMRGESDAGRRELETALDLALGSGLTTQAADAYRVLGNVREYASCYQEVPDAFAKALSYCRRHGESDMADLCLGCLSYSLFRGGSWRKSAEIIEQVTGFETLSACLPVCGKRRSRIASSLSR